MAYFLDTSAAVKRYVAEVGSAWVTGLIDPQARNEIWMVSLTGVEVVSAIARRHRGGSVSAADLTRLLGAFRHEFGSLYRVVEVTPDILNRAMRLAEAHALRGYDAVQLAAALEANDERLARKLPALTLVSADDELNAAAQAEGLAVENPNAHP